MNFIRKILLLFILSIVCTSCSAEYNINIDQYGYSEDIYITKSFEDYYKKDKAIAVDILKYHQQLIDIELDQPAQIDYYTLSSYYTLFSSGAHLYSDFRPFYEYPNSIYKCYDDYIFESNEGIITLKTVGNFLCPEYLNAVDNLTLNITSSYELLETNANSIENNKYTWDIKKNDDKSIYLKLSTIEDKKVSTDVSVNWNLITLIMSFIIIIAVIVLVVIFIIKRKANKI